MREAIDGHLRYSTIGFLRLEHQATLCRSASLPRREGFRIKSWHGLVSVDFLPS